MLNKLRKKSRKRLFQMVRISLLDAVSGSFEKKRELED